MRQKEIKIFKTIEELAGSLIQLLKSELAQIPDQDFYSLALSGGSTPAKIFDYISKYHATDLPWEKVRFFWGDERCVPPGSDESNYQMAHDHLLEFLCIPRQNIFRVLGELEPEQALDHYRKILMDEIPQKQGYPCFDMVLLGLGDDGHTASVFPGDQNAIQSQHSCEIASHPASGQKRITITLPVINNAANIMFLVTGASKAQMVATILEGEQSSDYPAAKVGSETGNVIWLLDEPAANAIKK